MSDKECTLCGWKLPLSIGFSDVNHIPTLVLRCPGTHPGGEIVDFHCVHIDNAWVPRQHIAKTKPPDPVPPP